jgi:hypothetical protein
MAPLRPADYAEGLKRRRHVDILSDILYLGVAAVFFALSFGLIRAFGRMMNADGGKERKA